MVARGSGELSARRQKTRHDDQAVGAGGKRRRRPLAASTSDDRTLYAHPTCNVTQCNVNVEFKVTLHEQVRYRGTVQY